MNKVILFLALCFICVNGFAQMEVTDAATAPYTPENLITNVFLGEGVEVTNFQYDGSPQAVGYFQGAEDAIGIDRGIIMTTGRAATSPMGPGADGVGSQFAGYGATPNVTADADLTTLDPNNANNDISRYIISFIPTSDTVRFNYSFASEEYPEYSCSPFNDVFGFFISGPGINGPFSNNAENIAIIPGTDTYVSINNLHPTDACPAVNEEFYNNNNGSNSQPVYDGYTDLFTAEAIVIPCEEYTLKIVIADKGDNAFDSGVFLQAKSFSSPPLAIDIATVSLDGGIVEGCSDAVITMSLPDPVESDLFLDYEILGDAINGVDYQEIPLDLFIPEGQTSVTVPLVAFEDGIDEGVEFFSIAIQVDPCNRDTFSIPIRENQLVEPTLVTDTVKCASEIIVLNGELDLVLPEPPTFTFSNTTPIAPVGNSICSSVDVFGIEPFTMQAGVIQSVCFTIEHNWADDLDVFLQGPGGQFIELTTDNGANGDNYTATCFTEDATTAISFPEPFAPASAAPFTGDWLPEGPWSDLYGANSPTNGEWQLCVIDDSNGFTGQLIEWSITFNPVYRVFYEWTPAEGLSCSDCPNPDVLATESTGYSLRAYDSYGCEVFDSVYVEVFPSLAAPTVVCSEITADCITFSWDDTGAASYEVNVDGTGWIPANGATSHQVCGLGFLQTVNIEVRGAGAGVDLCPSFTGTGECMTPACVVPSIVTQNTGDVSCFGGDDGSLTIEMTGNFPPFTYEIDGQTEANTIVANFTTLTADLHDLVITDASGCQLTLQVLIEEPPAMIFEDVLIQNVQCNGADDGSATVGVTNGAAPYSFMWSSGETDSIAVALPPGNALVTVTDSNNCSLEGSIPVTEPDAIMLELATENIICHGTETGTITSMASGGEGALSYTWSDPAGQTTPDAVNLLAGDYTLVVTDENNCSITESINIPQNSEIVTGVVGTDATCNGVPDGTATASASGGGVGFYTYLWDNNAADQTTETANNLDVGLYYVTITDLFNCAVVDSIEIVSPNPIEVDLTTSPTDCFNSTDGGASLSISGGTAPFTYTWSDGGIDAPDRTDLASGMQTVTVTDDNDCFVVVEVDVPAPTEISIQFTQITDASCFGFTDGTLTAEAIGGAGNFTYEWDDPATQSTATATNLPPGTYCVTARDENNCSFTLCEDISEPSEITATEAIEDVSCFEGANGQITVTPTGGTGSYSYSWNDANNQETPTATGLLMGNYEVIITDENDCTFTNSYQVNEPTELTASTDFTALSCDGTPDGTATATALGGTEPYSYTWENGQTTQTAIDLDAITYQVTVTDINNCEATSEVTLTEPVAVVIDNVPLTPVTCFGGNDGAATIEYSGGTAPFDISWTNGETGETITDLTAGSYTVNISDQSGCTASETVEIIQPEDLNITLAQTSSLCNNGTDGTASVTNLAYGNTNADLADFTYVWNTTPNQQAVLANNLTGGQTYSVLITDAAGCEWLENITIDNPAPIEAEVSEARDISCFEGEDGSIQIAAGGGTEPYAYEWSANADGQTSETADNLIADVYTVTISDANDCATSVEVRLEQPDKLVLDFEMQETSCPGLSDGQVEVVATGGISPYVYAWSSGVGGAIRSDLAADLYTVSVLDGNNCTFNDTIRVGEPAPVVTEIAEIQDVTCFGYRDGFIDLASSGGTPPYTYSLDGENFFGSSRLIALEAGFYDITIRDGNDCDYELFDIEVEEPEEFIVNLGEDLRINYGDTPQLIPDISGSAGGDTYEWLPVGPFELSCYDCSTVVVDTFAGQAAFELIVTDNNDCVASDLITIFVNKEINIAIPTGFTPNNDSNNDVLLLHGDSDIKVDLFRIYDRWGELVFEIGDFMLNDTSVGWDGKFRGADMPAGVYVWYLEIEAEDGEPATFKGSTNLLR